VPVEIGGEEVTARVLQLRPDLDPVTRTPRGDRGAARGLAAALGETATLVLPETVAEPGFWAPLSALRKARAAAGPSWPSPTRPDGDAVVPRRSRSSTRPAPVFLRGALPPGNRIVARRASRVAPGQIVLVLAE
jgi:membrane fusion protein, multidrug efflux system